MIIFFSSYQTPLVLLLTKPPSCPLLDCTPLTDRLGFLHSPTVKKVVLIMDLTNYRVNPSNNSHSGLKNQLKEYFSNTSMNNCTIKSSKLLPLHLPLSSSYTLQLLSFFFFQSARTKYYLNSSFVNCLVWLCAVEIRLASLLCLRNYFCISKEWDNVIKMSSFEQQKTHLLQLQKCCNLN